jgi:small subunit ribosomal protein S8
MKQNIDTQNIRYTGQVSDPVADMLARLRNAAVAQHEAVAMPSSKLLVSIARILKREGYVAEYEETQGKYSKVLVVRLKYNNSRKPAITGMKRMSKPGLRQYAKTGRMPKVLGGLGVAIMSTSRGVMTSKEAAGHGVGGEVLAHVW